MADDHELWERIRGRDASAFEAFYRGNAARLCAFLRQLVGSPQAAEDLMQETFTHMGRSPNGFRPELGSLRGYLLGIGTKRVRLWRPVLLGDNRVLVNVSGSAATHTGDNAATTLYAPGLGRFVFSSVPFESAIEGKIQVSQVSFTLEGKSYLLLRGAPISRWERVWVLHQPD